MSIKVKQAIVTCLDKIVDKTFDEDTIRTLLISCREKIQVEGLVRELAHFIAHPERNQGMFHRKVNSRYTKFKLAAEQTAKLNSDLMSMIKTEAQLSDFMLSGVSVDKIEAKLFKILYVDGLDDLPEDHLLKFTGFTKNEIRGFWDQFYVRKDNFYYLKTGETENLIQLFNELPSSAYNPEIDKGIAEQLSNAGLLAQKVKSTIDSIQKVVRGAIYFDSVFATSEFKNEFELMLIDVIQKLDLDPQYVSAIGHEKNDILICIMTLLHDSKFVFYDKSVSETYLSLYVDDGEDWDDNPEDRHDFLFSNGVLALYLRGSTTVTFPLFVSDLRVKDYITYDKIKNIKLESSICDCPWITAARIGSKLELIG